MTDKKKELKEKYKQTKPQMGIFIIKNKIDNKCLICPANDLNGVINSARFKLEAGLHSVRALQKAWIECGESNFIFEILDTLDYDIDETKTDYKNELQDLKDIWIEKLLTEQKIIFYK